MMDRRHLLRIAAPAVALPMVASLPTQAKEQRLVTRDEIMQAFRFYDGMEMCAEDLNLRYQILIDMLFETNPETLRDKLQLLVANRSKRLVIVDANTGQAAPFDPSMYDELGRKMAAVEGSHRVDISAIQARLQEQLQSVPLPKPKLRYRVAAWLMGWRA
jgi:hypothetical protein